VRLGTNNIETAMNLPGLYEFATLPGSNYTVLPAAVTEAESLSVAGTSGDAHQVLTNAVFSNLRGTRFNANAAGDFVTYLLPNLGPGKYRVRVAADAGADRGQFQLACGPGSGVLTNLGPVHDTYSPTNVVYLMPNNVFSPAVTALWTNLLREFDCGTLNVEAGGNYELRFTVPGRNTSSTGYVLSFDHIKLTPVLSDPAPTPLEAWRSEKFGDDVDDPSIAGDDADPDRDGLPNLLEYGLLREPLISETSAFVNSQPGDYLTVFFQRAIAASDVGVSVEVKTHLEDVWTTNVQPLVVAPGSNELTETILIQDTLPMSSAPHRFMRLRAQRTAP
jgi:hypothetical protein